MKKSRILAFIIAAALPFSLLSCTDNSGSISKTSTSSVKEEPSGREHMDIDLDSLTVPYEPIDLDDYRPYITDLLDDIIRIAQSGCINKYNRNPAKRSALFNSITRSSRHVRNNNTAFTKDSVHQRALASVRFSCYDYS